VRSVGYSELIVLSRDDVLAALKDHPDAEVGDRLIVHLFSHIVFTRQVSAPWAAVLASRPNRAVMTANAGGEAMTIQRLFV